MELEFFLKLSCLRLIDEHTRTISQRLRFLRFIPPWPFSVQSLLDDILELVNAVDGLVVQRRQDPNGAHLTVVLHNKKQSQKETDYSINKALKSMYKTRISVLLP